MEQYKVILVDDEVEVIDVMKKKIRWNDLGFDVVGSATNGVKALELVEKLQPDVVLTDIKMPYMDGLELARKLNQDYPNIYIMLCTGFDEFEYAKEALAFGALSFVLKPLNPKELTSELMKCKEKIQRIQQQKLSVKKMQEAITQNQKEKILLEQASGINIYEDSNEIWNQLGISTKKQIVVLIARFQGENNDKRAFEIEEMIQDYYPEYEMIIINQRYTFILFGETDMAYKTQMLCTYLQEAMNKNRTWNGGISRVHDNIRDLKTAYHEAYSAAQKGKKDNRLLIYESAA